MKDLKQSIDELVAEGYINCNKHPVYDLYIYNYSKKTQFEKYWNEYTLMCRGLVLDGDGNIIARPFSKFFNIGEHSPGEIPYNESYTVTEKMDGSLGIGFWYDGEFQVATRGSFTSDQAIFAKKFLDKRIKMPHSFLDNYTYLFEIIYKDNMIVCNYNDETRMTLLAAIDNETSKELSHEFISDVYRDVFTDIVELHNVKDLKDIHKLERDNTEGVVIRFDSGFRVKVKWEEYVRLHRIVTGVSNKTIWNYLRNNESFVELIGRVPDEFYEWIKSTVQKLRWEYTDFQTELGLNHTLWDRIYKKEDSTRKDYALWVQTVPKKYQGALWKMYDNKSYSDIIWKAIEPEYQKPLYNTQTEEHIL